MLFALGRIHPTGWLLLVAANTVFFAQASLWNGFVTESIRITVQRPRPFVYADPQRYGNSPAHYTSFISGHTSFSAAAATSMVVLLARTGAPRALLYLGGSAGFVLVFLTGLFRVQAGRHFLTDVVAAAFIGTLVTLLLAYFTRARRLAD
jgi:membrane-associated phospholipid phosphatase